VTTDLNTVWVTGVREDSTELHLRGASGPARSSLVLQSRTARVKPTTETASRQKRHRQRTEHDNRFGELEG